MRKLYILLSAIIFSVNSYATNITVTSTADTGAGTLRNAIDAATNGDSIFFAANLAGQTISVSSQLTVGTDIVIMGFDSGDPIIISGSGPTRVFSISTGVTATLNWLNIANGGISSGGGIFNNGTAHVNYCNLYNNMSIASSSVHGGGAIYNNTTATLTVSHCEFYNNSATPNGPIAGTMKGGAIYNRGISTTCSYSSFYGNTAANQPPMNPDSSTGARGGAIYSSSGDLIINSCTFTQNGCDAISQNSTASGGAIFSSAVLNVSNSTFHSNTASANTNSTGGNIYSSGGQFTLYNTIVSDGAALSGLNIFTGTGGVTTSYGYNLIEDTVSSGFTFSTGDILGDPALDTLAYNNSAFTKTMALMCGSPAINTGGSTNAPTTDQAGQPRIFGGTIDIGAYEKQTNSAVLNLLATATDSEICEGEGTTIFANLPTAATYVWSSLGTGQSQSVSPTTTTTYFVTATETSSGCTDTSSVTITVNPLPQVSLTNGDPSICEGSSVVINGFMPETGILSWDNGLGTGQTQTVSPTVTTLYTVTGTVTTTGCSDSDTLTIFVFSAPSAPSITVSGSDLTTGSYSSYQWYLNGNQISGETSQTISPVQTGTYTVEVFNAQGCSSTSEPYVYTLVGIENSSAALFNVYPVPAIDVLTIETNRATQVRIINSVGETVKILSLSNGKNNIDVTDLPTGYYLLITQITDRVSKVPFVKS